MPKPRRQFSHTGPGAWPTPYDLYPRAIREMVDAENAYRKELPYARPKEEQCRAYAFHAIDRMLAAEKASASGPPQRARWLRDAWLAKVRHFQALPVSGLTGFPATFITDFFVSNDTIRIQAQTPRDFQACNAVIKIIPMAEDDLLARHHQTVLRLRQDPRLAVALEAGWSAADLGQLLVTDASADWREWLCQWLPEQPMMMCLCTCLSPWAGCPHVYAALLAFAYYLADHPEALFELRGLPLPKLFTLPTALRWLPTAAGDASHASPAADLLEPQDLGKLFGIELETPSSSSPLAQTAPTPVTLPNTAPEPAPLSDSAKQKKLAHTQALAKQLANIPYRRWVPPPLVQTGPIPVIGPRQATLATEQVMQGLTGLSGVFTLADIMPRFPQWTKAELYQSISNCVKARLLLKLDATCYEVNPTPVW